MFSTGIILVGTVIVAIKLQLPFLALDQQTSNNQNNNDGNGGQRAQDPPQIHQI